jgi:hypothetical protein
MSLDHSVQGAKRQSFKRDNPRDLLKRLVEENPHASEQELLTLFSETVESDRTHDYMGVIIEYWFTNNYHSLTGGRRRAAARAPAAAHVAAAPAAGLRMRTLKHLKLKLLELRMPNGKALAECTGSDCKRIGGWCSKLATKVRVGGVSAG